MIQYGYQEMLQDFNERTNSSRFGRVAAHALGAAAGFGLFGIVARICFPDNVSILTAMLAAGNLSGWLIANRLYVSFSPQAWTRALRVVTQVGGITLIFAAGELWNLYRTMSEVNKLSLMTLSLGAGIALLKLHQRSYAVSLFCFLLAISNIFLFISSRRGSLLLIAAICGFLGAQALITRPIGWRIEEEPQQSA
jgi:hypothetical protein